MRSLIFVFLSTFGRYVVLLLVPIAICLLWIWSLLLPDQVTLAVFLGLPLLVLLMSTIILVLGTLLAGVLRPKGLVLGKNDGPEIWSYWEKASPRSRFTRRQIVVTEELNASMFETTLVAGIFGRDQTLTIGFGLMAILDRPMFEAVLEHEFAHADLKHSSGLTTVYEFFGTFEKYGEALEHDLAFLGSIIGMAFVGLENWLRPELLRRSHQCEFEADRQSAERVGADLEAKTQLIICGAVELVNEFVNKPLERELIGSLTVPPSPLSRIVELRSELIDPRQLQVAIETVLSQPTDPESTHPSLAERVQAISQPLDLPIGPIGPPALMTILPEESQMRLRGELEKDWATIAKSWVMNE